VPRFRCWAIPAFANTPVLGDAQVDQIDDDIADLAELVEGSPSPGIRTRSCTSACVDVADLRQVIDRIRRTGVVTGIKTLVVLGAKPGTGGRIG
jgi:hypothetical protein